MKCNLQESENFIYNWKELLGNKEHYIYGSITVFNVNNVLYFCEFPDVIVKLVSIAKHIIISRNHIKAAWHVQWNENREMHFLTRAEECFSFWAAK